jgi:hypothetical protein
MRHNDKAVSIIVINTSFRQIYSATRHASDKGRVSIAPTHSSALVGEWLASSSGRALHPAKDPQYPLDRRLGGPQRIDEKSVASAGDLTLFARYYSL